MLEGWFLWVILFFVWPHREIVQVLVQQERLIAAFDPLTKGEWFWKDSDLANQVQTCRLLLVSALKIF